MSQCDAEHVGGGHFLDLIILIVVKDKKIKIK